MVRLSPPAFSGSKDINVPLPAMLRRGRAEFAGKAVLNVPAGKDDAAVARQRRLAALSGLRNQSLNVLTGGHPAVKYAKRTEIPAAVAELTGKFDLETAQT